jgi:hypothetical protein
MESQTQNTYSRDARLYEKLQVMGCCGIHYHVGYIIEKPTDEM